MLLVTFSHDDRQRIGVLDRAHDEIVDLSAIAPELPRDMLAFIAGGSAALETARRAVASGKARLALAQLKLLAPIPRPARNILCVGKNYRDHVKEVHATAVASSDKDGVPEVPIIFTKWPSSVIGPGDAIPAHRDPSQSTDYEGELGVIFGPGGYGIKRVDAMRHVYGYTIINDVTARRVQKAHNQWFLGKSLDGFCPMGPVIATADEVPDVQRLRVQTRVNDEPRQDGRVAELIFDIPLLIETISGLMTLDAGDILATGTPAGVGMGFKPPKFLHAGDRVSITIEPIGTLSNPVT